MTAVAQADLRNFAALKWPQLNHKARLRQLSRMLASMTDRRVRAVYNAEAGVRLRADEQAAILHLTKEAKDAVRTSQAEYRALEARIAALEAYFDAGDAEHGRAHMDGLRAFASGQGLGVEGSGGGNGPEGYAASRGVDGGRK